MSIAAFAGGKEGKVTGVVAEMSVVVDVADAEWNFGGKMKLGRKFELYAGHGRD